MDQPSSSSSPVVEPGNETEVKNESSQDPKTSIPKKIPPLPWTHPETVNLIQVYQEKWYSLHRGQLRANQWEEVAISVAARCGYDIPSKSGTQCRHKMEKLRKRYRSENQSSTISSWFLFNLMDQMERGPFPISVLPNPIVSVVHPNQISESTDEDDDAGDHRNHILSNGSRFFESDLPRRCNSCMNPVNRKRRRSSEIEEEEEEDNERGRRELLMELGSVVRRFEEGIMKIEKMKIEMMKETERYRMEMEAKTTEMIIDSHKRMVDVIARSFHTQKKFKKSFPGDVNLRYSSQI